MSRKQSTAAEFVPKVGQVVEVEICEPIARPAKNGAGRDPLPIRVRNERDARPLKTGDRVVFSIYYQRRIREGAIRVRPVSAPTEPAATE